MSGMDNLQASAVTQINNQPETTLKSDPPPKIPSKIKNLAFVLLSLSMIPFYFCSLGIATHVNQSPLLLKIISAFGALMITFLCGLHWGIAVCQDSKYPKLSVFLIVEGVVLSFAALGIFIFVNVIWIQIYAFIGIFVFIWLVDLLTAIKHATPFWFYGLRSLTTLLVIGLLVIANFHEMPKKATTVNPQQPPVQLATPKTVS